MGLLAPRVITIQQPEFNSKQALALRNLLKPSVDTHMFVGGGGAGKTHFICKATESVCVDIPGNVVTLVRKTAKDLMDTTYEEFMTIVDVNLIAAERKAEKEVDFYSSQGRISTVKFRGLDERNRWGSQKFGQIFIDEANEIELKDFIYLKTRLRHPIDQSLDWTQCPYAFYDEENKQWDICRFISMILNPPDEEDNWLRKLWLLEELAGMKTHRTVVRTSSYDNKKHLPPGYLKILEALPEAERERMLDGSDSVGIKGDPCTPAFERSKHLFLESLPHMPMEWVRGWDFGWTHPVVVWGKVINNCIYIYYENYGTKLYLEDFVKKFVKPTEALVHVDCDYKDWIDGQHANQHSDKSPDTSKGILRKQFGYQPRHKYSHPRDRVALINRLLSENRLKIHEKYCPILVKALAGGYYKDEYGEPFKDGRYDHIGDALGYLVWGEFGKKGHKGSSISGSEEEEQPEEFLDMMSATMKKTGTRVRNQRLLTFPSMR